MTAGLLYYSDCRLDARITEAVRRQIARCAKGRPIVSVTLKPVAFGENIVLPLERGQMTMFRQIRAGLEAIQTDIVFFCEHDVVYHPSHFEFVPPRDDVFCYNFNRWQVSTKTGHAAHYRCGQTSGLCASRALLIEHYEKRLAAIEQAGGYHRETGYEPGTNRWSLSVDPHGSEHWMSAYPNLDLRHGKNLSKTRWAVSEFRNKNSCQGWIEAGSVPGWGQIEGRFDAFLDDVLTGRQERERHV